MHWWTGGRRIRWTPPPLLRSMRLKVLNETTRDWLITISIFLVALAVTTAWMIGLVWGAIALMRWLFS